MLTDEEIQKNYESAMGLNCQDASKEFFKRQVESKWKAKGYKNPRADKMPKKQLFAIYQSNR